MPFASDSQRRCFFANAGFSEGATQREVDRNSAERENAIRSHHEAGGFSKEATDRAVARGVSEGFGAQERTTIYGDKGGSSSSEWRPIDHGKGSDGKIERVEDKWSSTEWAAFTHGERK